MSDNRYSIKNIDWVNTSVLFGSPVLFICLLWAHIRFEGFNPWLLLPAIILYYLTGLGITAGYHRLFSHRAYQAHPVVKFFLLIFGAGAVQNSALKWCADHRRHHTFVDSEKDPYNIKEGFFYAHMGWVLLKEDPYYADKFPQDLAKDKLVAWQHKHYLAIVLVVALIIPFTIGWAMGSALGGLAIIAFGRLLVVHHATFFINSLCHCLGSQPYTNANTARDSWLMALFTFGEGYHNFHHIFQTDYRNGIRWYHFDPTKWLIKGFEWMGLAKSLKKTPESKIFEAKMAMRLKRLQEAKPGFDFHFDFGQLEKMKEQVAAAQRRWQEMKSEYRALKKRLPQDGAEHLATLKANISQAKRDFKESYRSFLDTLDMFETSICA